MTIPTLTVHYRVDTLIYVCDRANLGSPKGFLYFCLSVCLSVSGVCHKLSSFFHHILMWYCFFLFCFFLFCFVLLFFFCCFLLLLFFVVVFLLFFCLFFCCCFFFLFFLFFLFVFFSVMFELGSFYSSRTTILYYFTTFEYRTAIWCQ